MGKMSLGDVVLLMAAFSVVAVIGGCDKQAVPQSNPVVEVKPVSCFDAGDLTRCHDAELHVTCYRFGSSISCVPDQWTYREDEQDPNQTKK